MGYIHLQDAELTERASRLAARLGVSEEDAIGAALTAFEANLGPKVDEERPKHKGLLERMEAYRREHPLPPATGLKADKAFYDSLNDEDDD